MAKGRLEFLTSTEIRRVHDASVRVLEEVGVALHSEPVAKMLVEAGSTASLDGKRVRIPQELVKSALAHAPKSILLATGDGKGDMRIPDHSRLYVSTGGEGVYIKEMLTGATRSPSLEDYRNFMIISDSLPQVASHGAWLAHWNCHLPSRTSPNSKPASNAPESTSREGRRMRRRRGR
jgi:trimethylamine--corrinoid protein Co-methyltransferase